MYELIRHRARRSTLQTEKVGVILLTLQTSRYQMVRKTSEKTSHHYFFTNIIFSQILYTERFQPITEATVLNWSYHWLVCQEQRDATSLQGVKYFPNLGGNLGVKNS